MSDDTVLRVAGVSKCYELYETPRDRLKQFVMPRMQRVAGVAQRKYFREFWSLRDISFELERGRTLGIVGRNGAGKSTLLQILCGTLAPTVGTVQVAGRVAALLELGAGFNPEFTGRENVFMAAQLFGLDAVNTLQRFDAIAAFADIGAFLDQPVKTYSSGMYVRLAFAVIAHVDADILVIDEALSVGDAYFSQKCMRFLRTFKERGTLLFVSHDSSAVTNLCDQAIWLDKGRLIESGSAKVVMQGYLEELYGATQETALPPVMDVPGNAKVINATDDSGESPADALQLVPPAAPAGAGGRFGTGHAEIVEVGLLNESDEPLLWVDGGEVVRVRVRVRAAVELSRPIVGFIVKDRLGQHLFGENTFRRYNGVIHLVQANSIFDAEFVFQMPILPRGEYSIAVAIAEGTQDDHLVHEWRHEALLFQSHSSSMSTGLVGIPMKSIRLIERALEDAVSEHV